MDRRVCDILDFDYATDSSSFLYCDVVVDYDHIVVVNDVVISDILDVAGVFGDGSFVVYSLKVWMEDFELYAIDRLRVLQGISDGLPQGKRAEEIEKLRSLMSKFQLPYKAISHAEFETVKEKLNQVAHSIGQPLNANTLFFKAPFEEVPELFVGRRVFLQKGFAYVAMHQVVSLVATQFRSNLSKCLVLTNRSIIYLSGELNRFQPGVRMEIFRLDAWYFKEDLLINPTNYIVSVSLAKMGNLKDHHDALVELVASSEYGILHLFSHHQLQFTNLKYSRVEIDEVRFEWAECMLDYI
ncbi:hypothetical protein ZIOFF_044536 [Zingiber officinale]|uniref:Uncharacterized protein n=1 Tax=Zingiber officinale TaxID=94328 RepID=A0A8J5FZA2_ZINOF|nr:hypothetical protein ZIOFF_044536 [Zingiber officinale]